MALAFALLVSGVFVAGVAVGNETKSAKFITRDEVKFKDLQGPTIGQLTGDVKEGRHWVRGEDGSKAKRLTAGSYWMLPGGTDHISACDKGADCLLVIWQKSKFDFAMAKDPAAPKKAPKK